MILIDGNVPEDQRLALRRWKPFQIDHDYWTKGVDEEQIAALDAPDDRFSFIVDRFLRHRLFRTRAKWMGAFSN